MPAEDKPWSHLILFNYLSAMNRSYLVSGPVKNTSLLKLVGYETDPFTMAVVAGLTSTNIEISTNTMEEQLGFNMISDYLLLSPGIVSVG